MMGDGNPRIVFQEDPGRQVSLTQMQRINKPPSKQQQDIPDIPQPKRGDCKELFEW
jgi:hypothetical protein